MSRRNLELGKEGEDLAVKLLRKNGYKIIKKNYRTRLGEIDIVATDKDTVCFIEVKARRSDNFGLPQEAILRNKKRQISKAALDFLKHNNLLDRKARFDVVSVLKSEANPRLDLIKNAFELDAGFSY